MMGIHDAQPELFSYRVDLDRRVHAQHPLRRVLALIDFTFAREVVAPTYGDNGNVSLDPAVLLKLMFLLFQENVRSERELMRRLPERLDWLWFLGYGLDDAIPDHSVLSKARKRWGGALFETLFVRTVRQGVEAGLVDGTTPPSARPDINRGLVSTTDPDAPCVSNGPASGTARPRYKTHRMVDARCGVITATATTPGDVAEPSQTLPLVAQHEDNTGREVVATVADRQYGTVENYCDLVERGVRPHISPLLPADHRSEGRYTKDEFLYDAANDRYLCPAGQTLRPRRFHKRRQMTDYVADKKTCAARMPPAGELHRQQGRPLHRPPLERGDAGVCAHDRPAARSVRRPRPAPSSGGRRLRAQRQPAPLQTRSLAAPLAPTNPGSPHRRRAEHRHPRRRCVRLYRRAATAPPHRRPRHGRRRFCARIPGPMPLRRQASRAVVRRNRRRPRRVTRNRIRSLLSPAYLGNSPLTLDNGPRRRPYAQAWCLCSVFVVLRCNGSEPLPDCCRLLRL